LEFARDLGYLNALQHKALEERYQEVGRMLQGLIKRYDVSGGGFFLVSGF